MFVLFLFSACILKSQTSFNRGVNLTTWFQVSNAGMIQFTKYTQKDLIDIKSLGCDIIRLPIALHDMTSGSPEFKIDPIFVSFLDSVVTWCEQLNLYIILDNHSFDPNVDTSPDVINILVKVWSQMAAHYKERSEYILYEILNEPHGISTSAWSVIQGQVIDAIRAYDVKHTIVVGGSNYNSYSELQNLPVYSDTNLLYTFHFYDPFMFTHQGATWIIPSLAPLSGVPFPYNSAEMPECPESLKGTWVEGFINSYATDGTVDRVKQLIDNAITFRSQRNVNIFCGEFGVYIPNSDNEDRCRWYKIVREYLEDNNIPWTSWGYKEGFGLFNKGSNEFFENDLNVALLDSLGFNIPPQKPFTIMPDSAGFLIYTDFIESKINSSNNSNGPINYYSINLPANGRYCLYWKGFDQFNSIGFDFFPDKDLTNLVAENYALDLIVRGSDPGIKFEIRFRDTKTNSPEDHPWRIGVTIDETKTEWDRKWHHVRIPLLQFNERGAWDNGVWYNPEGKFDWTKVDILEISTEWTDILGKKVWFDNIHIGNMDTAIVRVNQAVVIDTPEDNGKLRIFVAPNPMRDYTLVSFTASNENRVLLNIYSITGIKIRTMVYDNCPPGERFFIWDGRCDNGSSAEPGIYLCQIVTKESFGACLILKY